MIGISSEDYESDIENKIICTDANEENQQMQTESRASGDYRSSSRKSSRDENNRISKVVLLKQLSSSMLANNREKYHLMTALKIAAKCDRGDVIQFVLSKTQENIVKKNDLNAALWYACSFNSPNAAENLLENGADACFSLFNIPCIHIATKKGERKIARILLYSYPDLVKMQMVKETQYEEDEQDTYTFEKGSTPLHLAARMNNLSLVQCFIEFNAPLNYQDAKGKTPLMYSVIESNYQIVNELLSNDANVNIKDHQERTALHYAAKQGNVEIIEELIKQGASIQGKDIFGQDLMEYALDENVSRAIYNAYEKREGSEFYLSVPLHGLVKRGFVCLFHSLVNKGIYVVPNALSVDVRPLQMDSNNSAPIDESYDPSSPLLLHEIAKSGDRDFLNSLPVKVLVEHYMSMYGNRFLALRFVFFIIYLAALTFAAIRAAYTNDPLDYNEASDVFRILCEVYVIIGWAVHTILEVSEFFLLWKQEVHKLTAQKLFRERANSNKMPSFPANNNLMKHSFLKTGRLSNRKKSNLKISDIYNIISALWEAIKAYITDGYNVLDCLIIVTVALFIPLRLFRSPYQWYLASMAYFFNSISIFKLLTVSFFGEYVNIVLHTLFHDIPRFSVIFIFPLISFSGSFFLALRLPNGDHTNMTVPVYANPATRYGVNSNYEWVLLTGTRILIEQGSVIKENYLINLNKFAAFIFMSMLFWILLMNRTIFIAQLSHTYVRSRASAEIITTSYRLDFIFRIQESSLISLFSDFKKKHYIEKIDLPKKDLKTKFEVEYKRIYDCDQKLVCKTKDGKTKSSQGKEQVGDLRQLIDNMEDRLSNQIKEIQTLINELFCQQEKLAS